MSASNSKGNKKKTKTTQSDTTTTATITTFTTTTTTNNNNGNSNNSINDDNSSSSTQFFAFRLFSAHLKGPAHRSRRVGLVVALCVLFIAVAFTSLVTYEEENQWVAEQVQLFSQGLDELSHLLDDEDRPGLRLSKGHNASDNHPVVLIPGVVSTGLEMWQGLDCAKGSFRRRLWGHSSMVKALLLNPSCWITHMALDRATGGDPPGIKLRPALGLEAADYLITGYWVWGKVITNLADVGYDPNTLHMASYDWRLSYEMLEERDRYFSKLKTTLEAMVAASHKKAVVLGHSMGALVMLYFMQWVQSPLGGKAGPSWISDHLHAFVDIAGPLLGVPKAVSALLSGEMRDTAHLGALQLYLVSRFITPQNLTHLFRSWGSIQTMLPKGGRGVWGDSVVGFRNNSRANVTGDDIHSFLIDHTDNQLARSLEEFNSLGVAARTADMQARTLLPKYWANPLESALPLAPNMTLYCLYGLGKDTEVSYVYTDTKDGLRIDTHAESSHLHGVADGPGDGTVPQLSLGYMCARGWREPHLNPAALPVVSREYRHDPKSLMSSLGDLRGGGSSSDHVDIMGNFELTADILRIVTGKSVEPRFVADTEARCRAVQLPH